MLSGKIESLHFAAVLRLVSQSILIRKYFVNNVCCQFWSSKRCCNFLTHDCGKCVARFLKVLEIRFVEASTKRSRRLWAGGGGCWALLSQY